MWSGSFSNSLRALTNIRQPSNRNTIGGYDTDIDEVHIGSAMWSINANLSNRNTNTNVTTRDPILPAIVTLIIDTLLNYANVHNHSLPKHSSLPKEIPDNIEKYLMNALRLGSIDGEVDGYNTIRAVLGPTPSRTYIHKFSSATKEYNPSQIPSCKQHRIGLSVELTSKRVHHTLPLLIDAAHRQIVAFEKNIQFITQLNAHEPINNSDLQQSVSQAINAIYDAGKYNGFHAIQEKYKATFGVSNPWTYSFVEVYSDHAMLISYEPRAVDHTPKSLRIQY